MLFLKPKARMSAWLALGLVLIVVPLYSAVVPRTLSEQIQDLGTNVVLTGVITAKTEGVVPDAMEGVRWTRLTLQVDQTLLSSGATVPATATVYYPGWQEFRLSISPDESVTQEGKKVLVFLRSDSAISAAEAGAFKLDSFAEVYSIEENRRGKQIVLGKGKGAAVTRNSPLSKVKSRVNKIAKTTQSGK